MCVEAVELPAGHGGARLFDDARGTKAQKLDLESLVSVRHRGRDVLFAFGSGSTPARESVAIVTLAGDEVAEVALAAIPALYSALRRAPSVADAELNIEGVTNDGSALRFFQRGNGRRRDGGRAPNAILPVSLARVLDAINGGPGEFLVSDVGGTSCGLESLDGHAVSFTDATIASGRTWFLATAEDSPDAVRDGDVYGSVVGWIDCETGVGEWLPIVDSAGKILALKAEGIAFDPHERSTAWIVCDPDDASRPADLCRIRVEA